MKDKIVAGSVEQLKNKLVIFGTEINLKTVRPDITTPRAKVPLPNCITASFSNVCRAEVLIERFYN